MSPERDGTTAAWTWMLDELDAMAETGGIEVDDEALARLLTWEPPVGLGPLPTALADRALAVAARLGDTVEDLRRALAENRRHARAVTTVPRALDTSAAAYLDVRA
ncbi:hypothetical protein [Isoptericola sp. NPDC057391]|uniref:hypothetical protein n=1 Tax=Isoptericola sp. NPDC057391 TaxID=3346117 RepID=UPI0036365AA8